MIIQKHLVHTKVDILIRIDSVWDQERINETD